MKINTIQLTVLTVLMMFIGSSAVVSAEDYVPDDSASSTVVAKILIYEDGTYELTDAVSEKRGKKCKMKKWQLTDDGVERCRGFAEDEIEQNITIPLIRSKGSICWSTYNSVGEASQVCWPS